MFPRPRSIRLSLRPGWFKPIPTKTLTDSDRLCFKLLPVFLFLSLCHYSGEQRLLSNLEIPQPKINITNSVL